jgi:hypothetical protein
MTSLDRMKTVRQFVSELAASSANVVYPLLRDVHWFCIDFTLITV